MWLKINNALICFAYLQHANSRFISHLLAEPIRDLECDIDSYALQFPGCDSSETWMRTVWLLWIHLLWTQGWILEGDCCWKCVRIKTWKFTMGPMLSTPDLRLWERTFHQLSTMQLHPDGWNAQWWYKTFNVCAVVFSIWFVVVLGWFACFGIEKMHAVMGTELGALLLIVPLYDYSTLYGKSLFELLMTVSQILTVSKFNDMMFLLTLLLHYPTIKHS